MNCPGPNLRNMRDVDPNLRRKRAEIEPLMDVMDTYERCIHTGLTKCKRNVRRGSVDINPPTYHTGF
jgi:hypothetical protein